jgi:hypothetical protein
MKKDCYSLTIKKYRLLAGTFLLLLACNVSSNKNDSDMTTETGQAKFSLQGKWKLNTTGTSNIYPLPEFIIFKEKDIYSIEGKEGKFHSILDGGWYQYDSTIKELRINTANDAIKKFSIKERKNAFLLYENDKLIAEYRKEAD